AILLIFTFILQMALPPLYSPLRVAMMGFQTIALLGGSPIEVYSPGTFVYKEVEGVQWKVDALIPVQRSVSVHVLSIGGGEWKLDAVDNVDFLALRLLPLFPFRRRLTRTLYNPEDALDAGFIILSADYRLLSPTNGHAVVEDVKALFSWIALKLNEQLSEFYGDGVRANTSQIVAAGPSAGAYVSFLAGMHAEPKPKAVAALYGPVGALTSHWLIKKTVSLSASPTLRLLDKTPILQEPFFGTPSHMFPLYPDSSRFNYLLHAPHSTPPILETQIDPALDTRVEYIAWLMQDASFYDILLGKWGIGKKLRGMDRAEWEGDMGEKERELLPILGADSTFPPTFFAHGSVDQICLVEEAHMFEDGLKKLGVETQFVEVPGVGHSFDYEPGFDPMILRDVVPFLLKWARK
ncbi:hypothetical protein P7C70_g4658, partial [Phenoliferia sp. Uapishka_3]